MILEAKFLQLITDYLVSRYSEAKWGNYIRTNCRVSLVYFRKNLKSSVHFNEWPARFL